MEAILEVFFALFSIGPIKKKPKIVMPFYLAFVIVSVLFTIWIAADLF